MKYEIIKVRDGETSKYLQAGYEPFSTVAEDTSYQCQDSLTHRWFTQHQSNVYIFLRRETKEV